MAKQAEKTDLEKAKELIAKNEKENIEKCVEIYNSALKEINQMGYNFVPAGDFVGNKINTKMVLVKK